MDISKALSFGWPDISGWSLGETYESLVWPGNGKPTESEVVAAWASYSAVHQTGQLLDLCKEICAQRLAAGFSHDIGGQLHIIGTTEADLRGWDEVEKIFSVAARTNDTEKTVTIATDTGIVSVGMETWNGIMLAAETFRQPIWAASFAVQAKIASGLITTTEGVRNAPDWP